MMGSVGDGAFPTAGSNGGPATAAPTSIASLSAEPAALLEVLGEPILHRIVEVLRRGGVELTYLVADDRFSGSDVVRRLARERVHVLTGHKESLPFLVETAVKRCSDQGMEQVLLMETSAYLELEIKDFLQIHRSSRQRVTLAFDKFGSLPAALVGSSDSELAGSLLDRKLLLPEPTARYMHQGYSNRLACAQDLRRLAQDAMQHRCRIRPNGDEVKTGVWISREAYIHPSAHVVAPAYVGSNSRLRAGTLVSEWSAVERDCIVERGTVVRNSSILPGTYLGVCLDVMHTVIKHNRLVDVQRNVSIEVVDSLIGSTSLSRKYLAPGIWASVANKSGSSLRTMRGRFGTLLPKRPQAPVVAPARLSYAPAETWGRLKPLSRTDSSSI